MELFLLIDIVVQGLVFLIVFYFLYVKNERESDNTIILSQNNTVVMEKAIEAMEKTNQKFYEIIEKNQKEYLEQTTNFLVAMDSIIETVKAVPQVESRPLDTEKIENIIEKEDIPEDNLSDMPRIPIMEGINFQFEGDEKIIPFVPE